MANREHLNKLKKGVEAFNSWRRRDPDVVIGLSNANLSGADLSGANLSVANLSVADLGHAKLINTDLRGANLRDAILIDANLSGADLSGANLRDAILIDANLSGADLSGADLSGAWVTNSIVDANTKIGRAIMDNEQRKSLEGKIKKARRKAAEKAAEVSQAPAPAAQAQGDGTSTGSDKADKSEAAPGENEAPQQPTPRATETAETPNDGVVEILPGNDTPSGVTHQFAVFPPAPRQSSPAKG